MKAKEEERAKLVATSKAKMPDLGGSQSSTSSNSGTGVSPNAMGITTEEKYVNVTHKSRCFDSRIRSRQRIWRTKALVMIVGIGLGRVFIFSDPADISQQNIGLPTPSGILSPAGIARG